MNRKQLAYFIEVYKYRNFQIAADSLMISRQGLSKMIIELEKELNMTLFDRVQGGLKPTEHAIELMPHAKKIIDEFDYIENRHSLTSIDKKLVKIYAIHGVLDYLGVDFLTDFHRKYPNIILNITESTDSVALERLTSNDVEIAIIPDPIDFNIFSAHVLFKTRYCIIANKAHPLASKASLTYEDLMNQHTIGRGREWRCYQHNINNTLKKGIRMDFLLEISNEKMMHEYVAKNNVIAHSFDYMACRYVMPNTVNIPVHGDDAVTNVYIVAKSDMVLSRESQLFHDFLLDWIVKHGFSTVNIKSINQ